MVIVVLMLMCLTRTIVDLYIDNGQSGDSVIIRVGHIKMELAHH